MAMPMIETGYKPEFALGAVYQGANAANADSDNMMQRITDFLKAQKSYNEQPYDLAVKQYEGALADAKRTNEDYIPWQLKGQIGQMKTQDSAGELAQLLQPFKQRSEQARMQNEQTQNELEGQMQQLLQISQDQSVPEAQRIASLEKHQILAEHLKNTPKFLGQKELSDDRLAMQLQIAELRAQHAAELAAAKASQEKPAKTAEETMQRIMAKQRSGAKLTQEEIEAYNQAKAEFEYKYGVKVQPGVGATMNSSGKLRLGDKPSTPQQRIPAIGEQKPTDADLINKYLPKK